MNKILLAVIIVACLTGCATQDNQSCRQNTSQAEDQKEKTGILVILIDRNKTFLNKKEIRNAELSEGLKKAGALPSSKIEIQTTDRTEYSFVKDVLDSLRSNNYSNLKIIRI